MKNDDPTPVISGIIATMHELVEDQCNERKMALFLTVAAATVVEAFTFMLDQSEENFQRIWQMHTKHVKFAREQTGMFDDMHALMKTLRKDKSVS